PLAVPPRQGCVDAPGHGTAESRQRRGARGRSSRRLGSAPMGEQLVTIEAIRAAAQRLRGVAQRTPVELSRAASELVGHPTLLKCEHLQRTGSFKIRGAYNLISQLSDAERAR